MPDRTLLQVGANAPHFVATSSDGTTVDLDEMRKFGSVILVFYPADDTTVCTAQLCDLRNDWNVITAAGIKVLGINPASSDRHARFATKHNLPFPLISDTNGRIARQYGCRLVLGITRRTVYVVAPTGLISYARRGKPSVSEIMKFASMVPLN